MKSDITELTCGIKTRESAKIRVWSDGQRTSRADAPLVPALDVDSVDAVFAESTVSFISTSQESARGIESLTKQLSELEAQCAKLRDLLEVSKEH